MNTIQNNLLDIKKRIFAYELKYHRKKNSVLLLAASKGQSIDKIKTAFLAKQIYFGENYLQEALPKMQALSDLPIEWHFIGSIQSNKTKKIAQHFSWVHTVSNLKIAKRLSDQRPSHLPPLNICIEINIGHETNKSGVPINNLDELSELMHACLRLPRLMLRGLMAIPSEQPQFEDQRQAFHQLHTLLLSFHQQGIKLDTLSMGMSADFEAAIAEGATIVRVGSALFGKRQ